MMIIIILQNIENNSNYCSASFPIEPENPEGSRRVLAVSVHFQFQTFIISYFSRAMRGTLDSVAVFFDCGKAFCSQNVLFPPCGVKCTAIGVKAQRLYFWFNS